MQIAKGKMQNAKWKPTAMRFHFALCIAVCVAVGGCVGGSARHTKDLHVLESEVALKRAARELDRRMLGVRTFRAAGALTGSWMGQNGAYQVVCAVRWPTDLRLDLLDPALGTVASLAVTNGEAEWYLPQEGRVYHMEATAGAMGRIIQLPWSVAEVAGLLTGLPPMEYGDRFVDWWMGPEGWAISPDDLGVLSFDGSLPSRYVRFGNADRRHVRASIRFEDYRPVRGYVVPHTLQVEIVRPKTTLILTYDSVDVNPPLMADVFSLAVPEGTKVVELR